MFLSVLCNLLQSVASMTKVHVFLSNSLDASINKQCLNLIASILSIYYSSKIFFYWISHCGRVVKVKTALFAKCCKLC